MPLSYSTLAEDEGQPERINPFIQDRAVGVSLRVATRFPYKRHNNIIITKKLLRFLKDNKITNF